MRVRASPEQGFVILKISDLEGLDAHADCLGVFQNKAYTYENSSSYFVEIEIRVHTGDCAITSFKEYRNLFVVLSAVEQDDAILIIRFGYHNVLFLELLLQL